MRTEEFTFQISKQVYEGSLSKNDGINKLFEKYNMNQGSASIIIGQVFPKLLDGQLFKRTLSVSYFECFLDLIYKDYGIEQLSISLSALKMHVDYIATTGDSKIKLRKIYDKYLDLLKSKVSHKERDEIEQLELIELNKDKSLADLKAELDNLPESSDEEIIINQKSYKRDNKAIALIKILRGFSCQICNESILKRDGSKYIEAAHIISKCKKGKETADNILLLCPNHHKEFDLGYREIITHTHDIVKFVLNGNEYEIFLSIEC